MDANLLMNVSPNSNGLFPAFIMPKAQAFAPELKLGGSLPSIKISGVMNSSSPTEMTGPFLPANWKENFALPMSMLQGTTLPYTSLVVTPTPWNI